MQIVYILMFPLEKKLSVGNQIKLNNFKSSPYFLNIDIDIRTVGKKIVKIAGRQVKLESFIYDNSVLVFQGSYDIGKILSEKLISLKSGVNSELRELLLKEYSYNGNLIEEYTISLVENPKNITKFIEKNQFILARLIRSVDNKINKNDADETLQSQVSYSNNDLAIVDWEGALLIDIHGDFGPQMELLKIGNYQLLRYRILDKMIEDNLEKVRKAIEQPRKLILDTNIAKSIVENRLTLLLNFDKVDQSLLLVGDWYSAKLYKTIIQEFYVDDWKTIVKNKLDNLEAIDEAARENLVFNWRRFLDVAQLVGWFVILAGYFILLLKDANLI